MTVRELRVMLEALEAEGMADRPVCIPCPEAKVEGWDGAEYVNPFYCVNIADPGYVLLDETGQSGELYCG